MVTKTVEINFVRVVVPINAQPGDELMILGEACIGVQPAAKTAKKEAAAPKKEAAPKKSAPKRKSAPHRSPPGSNRNKVLACFKTPEDRLTNYDVARMVGLTPINAYYHLNVLRKKRKLMRTAHGGQNIYSLYKARSHHKINRQSAADSVQDKVTEAEIMGQFQARKTLTSLDVYNNLNLDETNRKRAYTMLRNLTNQGKLIGTKPPGNNPAQGIIYRINEIFGGTPSPTP